MREKISITLLIVAIILLITGFLALLALGITSIVGFAGANIPFGFAFLLAMALTIAYAATTADYEVRGE
jgi:purine-cytosine permease-like protein